MGSEDKANSKQKNNQEDEQKGNRKNEKLSKNMIRIAYSLIIFLIVLIAMVTPVFSLSPMDTNSNQTEPDYEPDYVYIYKDDMDGSAYIRRWWIGSNDENRPPMKENVTKEQDTEDSIIYATINLTQHDWGGYVFLNRAMFVAGSTWELLDMEENPALDLSGASNLTFYACGEKGGERVEFYTGGFGYDEKGKLTEKYPDSIKKESLGYITLSKEWEKYEIPLNDKDLSRIGCGFAWMSSSDQNPGQDQIGFYIDDIRYEFPDARFNPQNYNYDPEISGKKSDADKSDWTTEWTVRTTAVAALIGAIAALINALRNNNNKKNKNENKK